MTTGHLFSHPLFKELFDHHLVSADGRIIATQKKLKQHMNFVEEQYRDRTKNSYRQRNEFVAEILTLLKDEIPTQKEQERIDFLLDKLGLVLDPGPYVSLKEMETEENKYAGPRDLEKSRLERKLFDEAHSKKILRRELKALDDWLQMLHVTKARVGSDAGRQSEDQHIFWEKRKKREGSLYEGRKRMVEKHNAERLARLKRLIKNSRKSSVSKAEGMTSQFAVSTLQDYEGADTEEVQARPGESEVSITEMEAQNENYDEAKTKNSFRVDIEKGDEVKTEGVDESQSEEAKILENEVTKTGDEVTKTEENEKAVIEENTGAKTEEYDEAHTEDNDETNTEKDEEVKAEEDEKAKTEEDQMSYN